MPHTCVYVACMLSICLTKRILLNLIDVQMSRSTVKCELCLDVSQC